jgi:DNA-binding LytR/AlgR family response regulator
MGALLYVKNRFQTVGMAYDDVVYVMQERRKIFVFTVMGNFWEYSSMDAMLSRMDGRMFRCHHSLAVNMDRIRSINRGNVVLFDGSALMMCHEAARRTKRAWECHICKDK